MRLICRMFSAFVFVVAVTGALAQSKEACGDDDSRRAWESGRDPVYSEAMELARTLVDSGFEIECVRSSKQANFFDGQKGAAWYKTKEGVFEVLFLPESKTFKGVEIVDELRPGGWHRYSFRGTPHSEITMDCAKAWTFIRRDNLMFTVQNNEKLAQHLRRVFPES